MSKTWLWAWGHAMGCMGRVYISGHSLASNVLKMQENGKRNATERLQPHITGFVQTMESTGIILFRIPGLESPGKRHRSWKTMEIPGVLEF